ncbi:HlyD family type I secretion periplasmic adaptor subunit [Aureimonas ureilytica]|uniref:HlyD family type I secretion periplasmic adaptor subunit n=1 Tax=Aureimonas ureilytica TaxID=401562 RepID=UPI0003603E0E|nr:HlyD family type I secretion periplasmic adaptor subunit [Aureimonas ureilytica]
MSVQLFVAAPKPNTDWRAALRTGYIVLALGVGLCGGWASFAHINSAVVVNGVFSMETYRRTVQHLEGGIVSQILVRDGDLVEAGQTLIRLDTTRTQAAAATAAKNLANALATEARLVAQRDLKDYMVIPEEATSLLRGMESTAIEDNHREFESRRQVLNGALELLDAQEKQVRNEIEQTRLDTQTANEQIASLTDELRGLRQLFEKGLVAVSRVTALERQKTLLEGTVKKARNDAQKAKDKIAEIALRKEVLRKDYRQESANALVEIGKQIAASRQERQIALDQMTRTDIRSPATGTVQQMRVFTVGGVVRPGEPLMDVVPQSDEFTVKAKVAPTDIDRIREGMDVEINLNALTKYRREKLMGKLRYVSRDVITEGNASTPPYFSVEVTLDAASFPADIREKIVAGMEAAIIIPTKGRTVLQYLTAPVLENMEESLRER